MDKLFSYSDIQRIFDEDSSDSYQELTHENADNVNVDVGKKISDKCFKNHEIKELPHAVYDILSHKSFSKSISNSNSCTKSESSREFHDLEDELKKQLVLSEKNNTNSTMNIKPRYQKWSHDERQLPPVGIDISKDDSFRAWFEKTEMSINEKNKGLEKNFKNKNKRILRKLSPNSLVQIQSRPKRFAEFSISTNQNSNEKKCNAPIPYAKEDRSVCFINTLNKPKIIASWVDQLKPSIKANTKITSEQVTNPENDKPPKKQKLFLFKKVKRADYKMLHSKNNKIMQNEREVIRRRLAMSCDEENYVEMNNPKHQYHKSHQFHSKERNCLQYDSASEISSDAESHSSDSETCPKLSKFKSKHKCKTSDELLTLYQCEDGLISAQYDDKDMQLHCIKSLKKILKPDQLQKSFDKANELFAKQFYLELETRMALSHARTTAHIRMKAEKQKKHACSITEIIKDSLFKVGILMAPEKRRVSRQMLTMMNVAQLQIIVNELHTKIENLNDYLVDLLTKRDNLYIGQNLILTEIKNLK